MKKSNIWKYLIIIVVGLLLIKGVYTDGIVHFMGNHNARLYNMIARFGKALQDVALSLSILFILLHDHYMKRHKMMSTLSILTIVLLPLTSVYIFLKSYHLGDISLYLHVATLNEFLVTFAICLILVSLFIKQEEK